ncbi:MAG: DoxX family protein [Phycisphaerae bacterium]|nr:DoxX family protein [Phycisphaerae bacterium]
MKQPDARRSWWRRIDDSGILLLLARLWVGGMFFYLAIMKLADPIEFLKQTHEYGVVPVQPAILLNLTAVVMPWIEILCAVALLAGIWVRGAAVTILGMLLFFAPLLLMRAWSLYQTGQYASFCDVSFDCGCGTGVVFICSKMIENTSLKIGALIVILSRSRRWCLEGALTKRAASGTRPTAVPEAS